MKVAVLDETGQTREILLSQAAAPPVETAEVLDENNETKQIAVTGEYPLTLYIDGREIITLMTLGQMPEALALGWVRNQRAVSSIGDIEEVYVDWEVNAAAVYTREGFTLPERQTTTSGCGQGTMFGDLMEDLAAAALERGKEKAAAGRRGRMLAAPALFDLLAQVRDADTVYKVSGAVHACALAEIAGDSCRVLQFVEDVGRHNAVDAIAGWMWLNNISGAGKVFYTTGRLTSEMAVKCAQMGIPYLVSRSGATRMGLEVAQKTGITMFARAVNRRYLLLCGRDYFKAEG